MLLAGDYYDFEQLEVNYVVIRLNRNGLVDQSFADQGVLQIPKIQERIGGIEVCRQADGKFAVLFDSAADAQTDGVVLRRTMWEAVVMPRSVKTVKLSPPCVDCSIPASLCAWWAEGIWLRARIGQPKTSNPPGEWKSTRQTARWTRHSASRVMWGWKSAKRETN